MPIVCTAFGSKSVRSGRTGSGSASGRRVCRSTIEAGDEIRAVFHGQAHLSWPCRGRQAGDHRAPDWTRSFSSHRGGNEG